MCCSARRGPAVLLGAKLLAVANVGDKMAVNFAIHVRPDYARQEPDTVRRMVRALLKGSRFITDRSPREIAEAVQKTPLGKFPKGVLLAGVASLKGAFPPTGG